MFIASLSTIAKRGNQPKCPSTDEWIKKMCYVYHGILAIKKEWNNVICSDMDRPRDYPTKWSESVTERQILYDISYM